MEEESVPLGVVPTDDRGALPFALLHGEPLVVWASSALENAGVDLVDFDVAWDDVRSAGRPLVVHDPLCPAVPAGFIADVIEIAVEGDVVAAAVRPVTDTLKRVEGDLLGATVDRDALLRVVSPVVLPASVVAALDQPELGDLAGFVDRLRGAGPIELVDAPASAVRVDDEAGIALLEAAFQPFSD